MKRVLLLFISYNSGHHCAALAVEKALRLRCPDIDILNINSFNYTNPILEKIINNAYMSIIRNKPEVWDYLYDNPKIVRRTQKLRQFIHNYNSGKLKTLLDDFKPQAIVCTQAFPCGMVADYKKSFSVNIPLVGVLTDYAPHSYWLYDSIDAYVVAAAEAREKLIKNHIAEDRIFTFGIPIDPKFTNGVDKEKICRIVGLDAKLPTILIMGGGQGLGAIKDVVGLLEKIKLPLQMVVVCGTNRRLKDWLEKRSGTFKKNTAIFGYTDMVSELMGVSDLIITKPGGMTTAEALARGLPMLILDALPGQEAKNTEFLTREKVAAKADDPEEAVVLIEEMLKKPQILEKMRLQAANNGHADAALKTADLVLGLIPQG